MKNNNINITKYLLLLGIAVQSVSCKKLIAVDAPATSTNADVVFSSDGPAAAVMTGVYAKMNSGLTNVISLSVYPELSADNLVLFAINSDRYLPHYRNQVSPVRGNALTPVYWNLFYPLIYNTNAVIEGAGKSITLTKAVKDQLLGEAYFMRAFSYFYLVNLYGDVPLVLVTAYHETATMGRSSSNQVYQQIVADLMMAAQLLNQNYTDAGLIKTSLDRLRPNKAAATALLARVYLYTGDYVKAEAEATKVIDQTALYGIIPPAQVFIKNSKETIWALQPVVTGENTSEARFYTLPASGPNDINPVYLSDRLMTRFESNDQRRMAWTGSITASGKTYSYPSKYKIISQGATVNEYGIVLRLAEQYLIRAEARAQQSNTAGARSDLDAIRLRSGLGTTNAIDKDELLNAILQERSVEFFSEWGHRWFDLKRSGQINNVMETVAVEKGSSWKPDWAYYPVPTLEIQKNSNLTQNSGYQ